MSAGRAPQLILVNPPETKIRFRYLSEKGSHGPLTGQDKSMGKKKSFPIVKLINYRGKKRVYVRVSLSTADKKDHVLAFKAKKADEAVRDMTEYIAADGTAIFSDLKILSKRKHEIEELLVDQKIQNLREGITPCVRAELEKKYSKEVKERAKAILNSVRLKFEAFEEDKPNVPLCSLFSNVICNQKAASKGGLRIHRISRVSGSWRGGDEVYILCDRVQKENIKIRFYEEDKDQQVIWEGYGIFTPADVHYQVAIPFKTPPYKENVEKSVFVCLERDMDDGVEMSEARQYKYIPEDIHLGKKRKYNHHSNAQPKDDLIMDHEEIVESSPMDAHSSDSSSNDLLSKSDIFGANQNMNLYSSNDLESSASASSPDVSSINGGYTPEVSLKDFGLEDKNFDFANSLLTDFDMDPSELSLFPQFFEGEEEKVDNCYNGPQMYNQCDIDGAFGELVVAPDKKRRPEGMPEGQMGVGHYGHFVGQMGGEEVCWLFKRMDIISTVDGIKNKEHVLASKEENSKVCELSKKKEHNVEKIRKLLSQRDSSGNTLLHAAVWANKKIADIIKMIRVANCCIINEQNFQEQTALHLATQRNSEKTVKILLENGANPNLKDNDGNNCYHIAALHHSYEALICILYIQNVQPDVNAFNYEGLTPLHIAVMKNSLNCFNLFIMTCTADINLVEQKCCKSLLHLAVEFQPSFVPRLLEMDGVDVNVQDSEGNTPLHLACAAENINVVRQLLQARADPSLRNYKQNYSNLTQSDEDTSNEQVQANVGSNVDDDEDTSDGEMPADMTSNFQIQEILKMAAVSKIVNVSDSVPSPSENDEMLKELCAYLDYDDRWKRISMFFIEEEFNGSLECSESPTKALLTYIKRENQDSYIEQFKEALKAADLPEAVKMMDKGHFEV